MSSCIFADAVADHSCRDNAPRHEELRHCILRSKDDRLYDGFQPRLKLAIRFAFAVEQGAEINMCEIVKPLCAFIDGVAEYRLFFIKLPTHSDLLPALAGEHEDDAVFTA
ncbi:MAG: hypothetical protein E5X63_24880 [Mesorhizobium sp.]|nr:MAG: hypothetical protein E5X63_24880 [Mesorhizobium sp.]